MNSGWLEKESNRSQGTAVVVVEWVGEIGVSCCCDGILMFGVVFLVILEDGFSCGVCVCVCGAGSNTKKKKQQKE